MIVRSLIISTLLIATLGTAEANNFSDMSYRDLEKGAEENNSIQFNRGARHCLAIMYLAAEAGFIENPNDKSSDAYKAVRVFTEIGIMNDIETSDYVEDGKSDAEINRHVAETLSKVRNAAFDLAMAYDEQLDDVVVEGQINFAHSFFDELNNCTRLGMEMQ